MQKFLFTAFVMAIVMTTGIPKSVIKVHEARDSSCQLPQEYIYRNDAPEFDAGVFKLRRQRLMNKMKGEIAIISAEAGNDFIYLTGFAGEKEAIAVIDPAAENPLTLFVLPDDPLATLWYGERVGIKGAIELYGAGAAFPVSIFDERISLLLADKRSASLHEKDIQLKEKLSGIRKDISKSFYTDLAPILHEMRVIKDDWEIGQLEKAVEVTSLAYKRILKTVKPGQKEFEVQAEIEYVFRKNGLSPGFPSITGSGPNAAILHYIFNNRVLQNGDLLLMDVGASYQGYSADVTRTIPVNGKFSDKQRELYSLVLKANQEGIKMMVPGNRILDCHHRATEIMTKGLYELGLITDTTSWWQKRFYIHYRNNHYIGLDVHDVGRYGDFNAADRDSYMLNPEIRGRDLLPGMVMTIEPGIYLIADRLEHLHMLFGKMATTEELDAFAEKIRPVYEKYAGIGIRIEDDVLITEEGNRVLSQNAPKTIEEIEAAMN